MREQGNRKCIALAVILSIVWIIASWLIADNYRAKEARKLIDETRKEIRHESDGIALELVGLLSAKKRLAATLANAPYVRAFVLSRYKKIPLAWSATDAEMTGYLSGTAQNLGTSLLFIGDRSGRGIASNNAATAQSTVGHDYADREYFQQARRGAIGCQYAMGRTTGVGGIYFSAPVTEDGSFRGFVVYKADTASLSVWLHQADAFLSDEHGVIIASKEKGLELKVVPGAAVHTLPAEAQVARYGKRNFEPIAIDQIPDKRYPELHLFNKQPTPRLMSSVAIEPYGFRLTVMKQVTSLARLDREKDVFFILLAAAGLFLLATTTSTICYVNNVACSRERLRQVAERLEAAASAGIVGVWDWDIVNDRLVWDKVMYQLYGLDEKDVAGAHQALASAIHPEDKERVEQEIRMALKGEGQCMPEFRVIWPDGSVHYLKAVWQTACDSLGRPARMVGVNYDVTEQKMIQHQLDNLAYYDALTGLPNRRLLEDRLEVSLSLANRERRRLALLFIDLDKFKQVNDVQGHEAGDWLLKSVAQRLQGCLRASDTAARIGGDELIVLLPEVNQATGAIDVAEKIRQALELPFVMDDGQVLEISSSIGVVLYPDHADNRADLLRFGDEAMYRAKEGGRNAVVLYDQVKSGSEAIIQLNWKASFASGEPTLDRQHRELFGAANTILNLIVQKETGSDSFRRLLNDFRSNVEQHFHDEEAILLLHDYPDLSEHSQKHKELLQRIAAFCGEPEDVLPPGALVDVLVTEVVSKHLLDEDLKFFAHLTGAVGTPGTPPALSAAADIGG